MTLGTFLLVQTVCVSLIIVALMFPKESTYRTRRERSRTRYRSKRQGKRQEVYNRDEGRCVWPNCRRVVALESADPFRLANIHELLPRSLGGDPVGDIDGMVTVCAYCHADLHPGVGGKRKKIEGTSVAGGLVFFTRARGIWQKVEGTL